MSGTGPDKRTAAIPTQYRRDTDAVSGPSRQAGFALVNALVLVAAIAAVGVALMQVAALSRARSGLAQEVLQTRSYLDALESLAVIATDPAGPPLPVPGPERLSVPIDRGSATAEIDDLQGRFNINALINPEDADIRAVFDRLLAGLGLPAGLGDAIVAYIGPQSDAAAAAYARRPVPVRPPGDALALPEELRLVLGLSDIAYRRLAPHIAALPGETLINVNTVTPQVLAAFLPGIAPAEAAAFLQRRARDRFDTPEEFEEQAERRFGRDLDDILPRFGVTSVWFEARLSASLGATRLERRVILLRDPDVENPPVVHRRPGAD